MKEIDPHLPINKQAARVVSKDNTPKTEYNYEKVSMVNSMVRLPTIPFKGSPEHDLTGKKIGRFEVLGIYKLMPHKAQGSNSGARWVVRCDCGRYEIRSTKALKKGMKGSEFVSSCENCKKIKALRKRGGK